MAPVPGTPVQTPLVPAVQNAADAAVAGADAADAPGRRPAGTGEILAVSSNAAADAGNALTGQFPPGSSMKTMTATALLSAGTLTPDTPVACPGTTSSTGREFENENKFDLGTVPLHRGVRAVLQHDLHPAGPRRCPTARSPRRRRPTASAATGSCRSASSAAAVPGDEHRDDEGGRRDRPGRGADEPGPAGARRRRDRQRHAGRRRSRSSAPSPPGPAPQGPGQQVLDALRPMMRRGRALRDGQGAGRPRARSTARPAPPSSAATPRRTRTAGSWATGSAGRRATSRSPSSSRAVSPAAPRSPSPTPSSAAL